ncbi:MAG: hypothetical protein WAW37_07780 [Syntrophobacteraceae bacterium]
MKILKQPKAVLLLIIITLAACTGVSGGFQSKLSGGNTVDSNMPAFENRLDTDHFVLRWTNRSSHTADNISDPAVVKQTAGYLETAWGKYTELFGRTPHTAPGKDKVEVVFRDFDCYGLADPPDGPIQFNAHAWMKNPGIRQPTSAHELFHKMQYAYGYKTGWSPKKPYLWFTEGTAAWAEVYVWGRVSRTCKVDEIFKDTKLDLYEADDMAMPFWIYFVSGNREEPNHKLMVKLFEKCEQLKDEKRALNEVIQEYYGPPEKFFAAFSKDRKKGFWTETCSVPYRCILGPDGKDMVDKVKNIQKKGKNG